MLMQSLRSSTMGQSFYDDGDANDGKVYRHRQQTNTNISPLPPWLQAPLLDSTVSEYRSHVACPESLLEYGSEANCCQWLRLAVRPSAEDEAALPDARTTHTSAHTHAHGSNTTQHPLHKLSQCCYFPIKFPRHQQFTTQVQHTKLSNL